VGVEPTLGVNPNLISNQALSTTQPSLQGHNQKPNKNPNDNGKLR
jgi:hypothetical protein